MELSGCRASWDFFTDPEGAKSGRLRQVNELGGQLCCHQPIEERRWIRVILHAPPFQESTLSRVVFARVREQYELLDLWEDDSMTLYRHELEWIEPLDSDWVGLLTPPVWEQCDCGNLIPKNHDTKQNAQGLCGLCALRVVISGA